MVIFKNLNIQKPKLIVICHDVRNKTFILGYLRCLLKMLTFTKLKSNGLDWIFVIKQTGKMDWIFVIKQRGKNELS